MSQSSARIYRGRGEIEHRTARLANRPPASVAIPTIAGLVPITDVMTREVTCARRDLAIEVVIDLVIGNYIGCIPVVDDDGVPVGMITKRDLVEHLAFASFSAHTNGNAAAAARELASKTADDAMLPLAFTLDEHATVAQATALLTTEGIHHIPVVGDTGAIIGVVSTLDIVRWLARNDGVCATEAA